MRISCREMGCGFRFELKFLDLEGGSYLTFQSTKYVK